MNRVSLLAWRFSRHRQGLLLLVGSAAFLLMLISAGSATVLSSGRTAVKESVLGDQAGRAYSLQVAEPSIALPAIKKVPDLLPVRDGTTTVTDRGKRRSVPARLRVAGTPSAPLGVLLSGRRAANGAEVTVSRYLAGGLGIVVGDHIEYRNLNRHQAEATVVGITRVPADVRDSTLVTLEPNLAPKNATIWLSERDPYSDARLKPILDQRAANLRTASVLANDEASRVSQGLFASIRNAPVAAAILLIAVLTGLGLMLRPILERDVQTLVAVGLAPSRSWRVVMLGTGTVIGAGVLLGAVVGIAGNALLPGALSHLFRQDWTHITIPVRDLAKVGVVLALWLGVALLATKIAPRFRRISLPTLRVSWLASLVLVALPLGFLVACLPVGLPVILVPLAGALLAAAIALTLNNIHVRLRRQPTIYTLGRRLAVHLVPLNVCCAVIVFGTSYYPAVNTHSANAAIPYDTAPQPAGSFAAFEIPKGAAALLSTEYRRLGGRDTASFKIPQENHDRWRVTSPGLVACLKKSAKKDPNTLSDACYPQSTASPINLVMLSQGSDQRADPGLISNHDVGLMRFTGEQAQAQSIATTQVKPDRTLGGNFPGLVIPENGKTAKSLNLVSSDSRLVAFLDFSRLPQQKQASFRALAARVAPAAQFSEDRDTSADDARALVTLVVAIGTALTVLLLTLVGLSVIAAQRRTRRMLADLGGRNVHRRLVALLWIGPTAISVVLAALVARGSAFVAGVHLPGSFGIAWLFPGSAALIVCALLAKKFLTVPDRTGE